MQDAPPIGEGVVIHGNVLLKGVAPRPRDGRDGVLYVVGGHEIVHRGQVALAPHLLEVAADESLVFLCGHGMPSSSSRFPQRVLAPSYREHDATDQSSTRTSIGDGPREDGGGVGGK